MDDPVLGWQGLAICLYIAQCNTSLRLKSLKTSAYEHAHFEKGNTETLGVRMLSEAMIWKSSVLCSTRSSVCDCRQSPFKTEDVDFAQELGI